MTLRSRSEFPPDRVGLFPKDQALYCIDVLSHRDFANIELLEILDRNWPALVPKLNGVSSDSSITVEQIITLRKKGVNYSPSLANGSVVFSHGGAFVAGGFSINHVMGAQHLEQRLKDAEQAIKGSAAKIRKSIRLRTGNEPNKVKVSTAQLTGSEIVLREIYSGIHFSFNC